MGGIKVKHRGSFNKTEQTINAWEKLIRSTVILHKYGKLGVERLGEATPVRTGKTANSWKYHISFDKGIPSIVFSNDNVNKGVNIAIILQYGHGTRNGGYVQGTDYINPVTREIMHQLADEIWKEVTSV